MARKARTKGDIRTLADAYVNASGREAKAEARRALRPLVFDMREGGASWGEIVEAVGWDYTDAEGRLQFLYFQEDAERDESLQINFRSRADLGKKVVKARDGQKLSWGKIAAYARDAEGNEVSESLVKAVYEEASGKSVVGNRIGKGGRLVGDGNGAATRRPAKTAPKVKANGRKAAAEAPAAKPTGRRARTLPEAAPTKTGGKRRTAKPAVTADTARTTRKTKAAPVRAPRRPARVVAE
jgi:hypothetical protein